MENRDKAFKGGAWVNGVNFGLAWLANPKRRQVKVASAFSFLRFFIKTLRPALSTGSFHVERKAISILPGPQADEYGGFLVNESAVNGCVWVAG